MDQAPIFRQQKIERYRNNHQQIKELIRMSNILLINATIPKSPRVAVLHNQKLTFLDVESQQPNRTKGNILNATITSIEPSLDAVFVNYGSEKHGFLPMKEVAPHYLADAPENTPAISRLRTGQKIIIQVEKERRGDKGAALTTYISLAGAYLVLMPYNPSASGISKKADQQDRDAVKSHLSQLNIPKDFGVIVRTAGVNRTLEELTWDLESLLTHWGRIEESASFNTAPCLIHKESDTILKAVRDLLHPTIESIVIDDLETFNTMKSYLGNVRPEFVDKLEHHTSKTPLFTHHQVEEQIERLFHRKLDLPSGGAIVIDYTEALTAIDVNSARATKGQHIEETAVQTNLEAADEIARQLRLRDISGIIVIDFIDMSDKTNRQRVEVAIADSTNQDRSKIRMDVISALTGCMILSRQRVNTPLYETNQEACSTCSGLGLTRTIHSNAHMMLRKIEENASADHTDLVMVQLPVVLATFLLNECRDSIDRIQKDHETSVMIIPNEQLIYPKFLLKRHKLGKQSMPESHKQIGDKAIHEHLPEWKRQQNLNEEPKVTQKIMKHPDLRKNNSLLKSVITTIKSWFGIKPPAAPEKHRPRRHNNRNHRRSPIHRRRGSNNNSNNSANNNTKSD